MDDLEPDGPFGPTEGFSAEVVQFAKMGRIYIQIALEETTTKAWAYFRSIRRAQRHSGRDDEELYAEYYEAVRDYQRRHQEADERNLNRRDKERHQ